MASMAHDEALISAQKAIKLEPNLSDGYVTLGFLKTNKGEYIDAEFDFRKAFELTKIKTLSATSMCLTAVHYHAVGNFIKAHELLVEAREKDPLNGDNREKYIFNLTFQNDRQGAEEEYERGLTLLGDKWKDKGDSHITIARFGAGDILSSEDILRSDPIYALAMKHLESPEEGLDALHHIFSDEESLTNDDYAQIAILSAYFGDPNFALDTLEKSLSGTGVGAFFFWFPVMHDVRQLPRFKQIVREIGLVDYWEKFGWPDLCHPTDDGDFVCD
jgi:tetratricopeptide (TPR) repeat protein